MGEKKVVNLSGFLLFEETGDSEGDFDGSMVLLDEADKDDDAESCSYEVGCYSSLKPTDAHIEISEGVDDDYDEGMKDWEDNSIPRIGCHHHHKIRAFEEKEEEEEEKEGIMSEVTSTANTYSSRKCVQQSSKKNMSEVEKSRLFWEACLAS